MSAVAVLLKASQRDAFFMSEADLTKAFLESASSLAKDLTTTAVAIVGLSITFLKDVREGSPGPRAWALKAAWVCYVVSTIFGFWTLMALTGTMEKLARGGTLTD
jgi:hypothetical protein